MAAFKGFSPKLFDFLAELSANNSREWFLEHKPRYEADVREPALAFIESMAEPLKKLSPHFVAVAKKTGGSLMRPYRDTRFSRDKTPYKTNVGIQFRHRQGKDVHSPGYYLHIDPWQVFVGVGMWHPEPDALRGIRNAIVERPGEWKKVRGNRRFSSNFELSGSSLKRPPRGFAADNAYIEDLKRKDFIGVKELSHEAVVDKGFRRKVSDSFRAGDPLMKFLCGAVGVPF